MRTTSQSPNKNNSTGTDELPNPIRKQPHPKDTFIQATITTDLLNETTTRLPSETFKQRDDPIRPFLHPKNLTKLCKECRRPRRKTPSIQNTYLHAGGKMSKIEK